MTTMCFSTPAAPSMPTPPKEPTLLAEDMKNRQQGNKQIKSTPMGIAAAPIMPPNILITR